MRRNGGGGRRELGGGRREEGGGCISGGMLSRKPADPAAPCIRAFAARLRAGTRGEIRHRPRGCFRERCVCVCGGGGGGEGVSCALNSPARSSRPSRLRRGGVSGTRAHGRALARVNQRTRAPHAPPPWPLLAARPPAPPAPRRRRAGHPARPLPRPPQPPPPPTPPPRLDRRGPPCAAGSALMAESERLRRSQRKNVRLSRGKWSAR